MIPAGPPAPVQAYAPAPGYAPAAAAAPPPQRAPRGPRKPISKKTLMIAGIAGIVIAGGIVAFLLLRKGGPTGGADSPEELAKRAAAALSKGDLDEYTKLSGFDDIPEYISCHFPEDNSTDDYRQFVEREVKRHVGVKVKIKSVKKDEDDKPRTMKAGVHLMDSCVLTTDMTNAKFAVELTDDSDVEKMTMRAMKLGDRWYFSSFDELPKGKDAEDEDFDKQYEQLKKDRQAKLDKLRRKLGSSPEAAIKALADATNWGSYTRAEAISVDRYMDLDEIMKCEYGSELSNKIDHTADLLRRLARFPEPDDDSDEYGGHTYGGKPHDTDADEPHDKVDVKSVTVQDKGTASSGDTFRECSLLKSIEWQDLEVKIAINGKDQDPAQVTAIKVDDAWRILYIRENP